MPSFYYYRKKILKKIKELYQLYELNISKKNLEELLNDLLIYVYKLYENEVD